MFQVEYCTQVYILFFFFVLESGGFSSKGFVMYCHACLRSFEFFRSIVVS